jgi:hypothetical protein
MYLPGWYNRPNICRRVYCSRCQPHSTEIEETEKKPAGTGHKLSFLKMVAIYPSETPKLCPNNMQPQQTVHFILTAVITSNSTMQNNERIDAKTDRNIIF